MDATPTIQPAGATEGKATQLHHAHEVRIVLCMIVKNEAHIIERCLASALPVVDGYVISDTGSSDDTLLAISRVAKRLDKPGRVVRADWQDFGHNRTLAARAARDWVVARGWPHAATYLLFLDADMVLEAAPGFDKRRLDAPAYMLRQDDGVLRYSNLRLARLSHDWRAIGVTHEYWQALGEGAPAAPLDTLWVRDVGDGGSKADKTARDIRGVEYAAGLLDNGDGTLTITYGYEDREARWTLVDRAAVLAALRPAE